MPEHGGDSRGLGIDMLERIELGGSSPVEFSFVSWTGLVPEVMAIYEGSKGLEVPPRRRASKRGLYTPWILRRNAGALELQAP